MVCLVVVAIMLLFGLFVLLFAISSWTLCLWAFVLLFLLLFFHLHFLDLLPLDDFTLLDEVLLIVIQRNITFLLQSISKELRNCPLHLLQLVRIQIFWSCCCTWKVYQRLVHLDSLAFLHRILNLPLLVEKSPVAKSIQCHRCKSLVNHFSSQRQLIPQCCWICLLIR